MTHQNFKDIYNLQNVALNSTMEEFVRWIALNDLKHSIKDNFITLKYNSIRASVTLKERHLNGYFDCYDDGNNFVANIYCKPIKFKC